MTFRRVVLPLAFPAIVAGSIFTFSLTLGDYIAVTLVSTTRFIGNAIFINVGASGDLPLAAAYSLVPLGIIVVYLLVARRLGAFEAL
jgi:putative spermidine/putrescine transport system permease protein